MRHYTSRSQDDRVDFEIGLQNLARQYQLEGYTVTVRPGSAELPPFAAGFDVQILATRADQNALVLVKNDLAALRASAHAPDEAKVTNAQPGWRYDFAILNRTDQRLETLKAGVEPTREQIEQMLVEAEQAARAGADRAAFLLAWAGLMAAMRDLARRASLGGTVEASVGELITGLTSWGFLSQEEYRRLRELMNVQLQLRHGLLVATDADAVGDVVRVGRRLVSEKEVTRVAG